MSHLENSHIWRPCNSCKKPILFGSKYWVCNVSTCNRKRTGLHFCSVSCWDAHLGFLNHRESWAEERKAPTVEEWARRLAEEQAPKKKTPKVESTVLPEASAPSTSPQSKVIRRKPSDS